MYIYIYTFVTSCRLFLFDQLNYKNAFANKDNIIEYFLYSLTIQFQYSNECREILRNYKTQRKKKTLNLNS